MAKNKISNPDNLKPFIAVPTTAGTGSETSRAAAIINDETKVKKIVFHPRMLPTLTILDPKLTSRYACIFNCSNWNGCVCS